MWLSFIIMWSPDSKSFMLLSRSFSFFFTTTKTSNSTMPLIRGPKVTCGSYYEKFNFCSCKCFPCFVAKGFFHIKIRERCSFTFMLQMWAEMALLCRHAFRGISHQRLSFMENKMKFLLQKRVKIATTSHTTFLRK